MFLQKLLSMKKTQIPLYIPGGLSIDARGKFGYVNDLKFASIKRFYIVSNHQAGRVRAWHAHKYESKYVFAVTGHALIGAVAIDDWKTPSKAATIHKFVLSEEKPGILFIPPGFANGFMSLTANTKSLFFSNRTFEQSKKDDIRYDSRYWDIWDVKEY